MNTSREHGLQRILVLVRHGQSQANADGLFTGLLDSPLTEKGRQEAVAVGRRLKREGFHFQASFTSTLSRAITTSALVLDALGQGGLIPERAEALDERDYGDLSGLNKAGAYLRFGSQQVEGWRRSYLDVPPNGESLRDTVARVLPFYLRRIQPAVMRCPTLVVSHGNLLRGLVMALEGLGSSEIEDLELATGSMLVYEFKADTTLSSRKLIT